MARAFATGDPAAVETVRARVCRILAFRGYGIPREDRKDLEQEVMVQLWRSVGRESFQTGAGFWGFVEVVSTRRCIDWLRTGKEMTPLPATIAEERPGPLSGMLARERRELAYSALAQLGKPCRDLIYLHAGLRMPYRKIARILGKSEGALRVQMHRCLQQSRRILLKTLDHTRQDVVGREIEK